MASESSTSVQESGARHPNVGKDVQVDDSVRKEFFQFTQAQGVESAADALRELTSDAVQTRLKL